MIQKGIGGKVVRFHVLANSDSEEDQTLKLAVRDRVLQEYGDLLESCTSKEETLAALKNAQQEISETAEAEVLAQGYAIDGDLYEEDLVNDIASEDPQSYLLKLSLKIQTP